MRFGFEFARLLIVHAALRFFVQQVGVVDVVEALASLMRRLGPNRTDRIQPSDIVNKLALQHGVDALVRSPQTECCCIFALDQLMLRTKCTGVRGTEQSAESHHNEEQSRHVRVHAGLGCAHRWAGLLHQESF